MSSNEFCDGGKSSAYFASNVQGDDIDPFLPCPLRDSLDLVEKIVMVSFDKL